MHSYDKHNKCMHLHQMFIFTIYNSYLPSYDIDPELCILMSTCFNVANIERHEQYIQICKYEHVNMSC